MYRYLFAFVIPGLFWYPPGALAVKALSTEELVDHCIKYDSDPDGTDGVFCVRYIQGFIDGAIVTDERVTYNIADEVDREETFKDRAYRTRFGTRLKRYGPSVYAEFCLGEPVPLQDVVHLVIGDLKNDNLVQMSSLARDIVYTTLRREFPCKVDAGT